MAVLCAGYHRRLCAQGPFWLVAGGIEPFAEPGRRTVRKVKKEKNMTMPCRWRTVCGTFRNVRGPRSILNQPRSLS